MFDESTDTEELMKDIEEQEKFDLIKKDNNMLKYLGDPKNNINSGDYIIDKKYYVDEDDSDYKF